MKYGILRIKRLSPNFASNIQQSFKGINLFPLKIPWFSNDFRKKKKFDINIRSEIRRRFLK